MNTNKRPHFSVVPASLGTNSYNVIDCARTNEWGERWVEIPLVTFEEAQRECNRLNAEAMGFSFKPGDMVSTGACVGIVRAVAPTKTTVSLGNCFVYADTVTLEYYYGFPQESV